MANSKPKLKLLKLPDSKPVKRIITLMPDLDADLVAYAKVYEKAYGEKAEVNSPYSVNACGISRQ